MGGLLAIAGVDLGMFLAQLDDLGRPGIRKLAVSAVGGRCTAVAGQRLGAGVEHELAGHGGADDRATIRAAQSSSVQKPPRAVFRSLKMYVPGRISVYSGTRCDW